MARILVILSGRPMRHYLELIWDYARRTRGLVKVAWDGDRKCSYYLDQRGIQASSDLFDDIVKRAMLGEEIRMLVGPPEGFESRPACMPISLGQLTFQHDLAALILVEQLYRAYCRMKGIPYEK